VKLYSGGETSEKVIDKLLLKTRYDIVLEKGKKKYSQVSKRWGKASESKLSAKEKCH